MGSQGQFDMEETVRIRIGNQTAYTVQNIMQPFEYAVVNGFDAFEWFPDKKASGAGWMEGDISAEKRSVIKEAARSNDVCLTVHASSRTIPLNPPGDKSIYETIEFAQDIGASLFNIHLSTNGGLRVYYETITPIINQLVEAGIKLSIENTIDTTPADINELFRRLREPGVISADSVGLCLDLGHANLCHTTRNDYLRYVDLIGPDVPIIHLHMHENYGDYDSHLPLFTGPSGRDPSGIMGLFKRLQQRHFTGCVILEQWPIPPSLLNTSRSRLLEIIDSLSIGIPQVADGVVKKISGAAQESSAYHKGSQKEVDNEKT